MNIVGNLLEVLYPIKCMECDEINERYLCRKCRARIGLNLKLQKKNYKEKRYEERSFENHLYLFEYKGLIREKIIQYKFNEKGYIYRFFAEEIIEINNKTNFLDEYDYIIPVPISKKRMFERGYNQSELIVKELCKKNEKLKMIKLVNKIENNAAQSTLSAEERRENVKDVYELNAIEMNKLVNTKNEENKEKVRRHGEEDKYNNYKLDNIKILIFDDIYTTGNTVNEVTKVLKNVGIKNIDVFTIAKD